MSRIAFFCIPAHGHINPTLGVVRELVNRGHEVRYYSFDSFREQVEAAGAEFVSCDAYDAEQRVNPKDVARIGKDLGFSIRLLTDTTIALGGMVCKEMKHMQPDCIVADSMAVWGKAVAMRLGIPFVSSTTTFAFNRYSARIMKRSAGQMLSMLLSMPEINKDIKRLQRNGYPIKSFLDIIQNDADTNTIVYTSAQFQPYSNTFSDKYAFVGPSVRQASCSIKKERKKLIYISMGTVNNAMQKFYKSCIRAFENTEYQVIMSVGNQVDIGELGNLPEHISVFQAVDQIAVLAQADIFLSHCGMNSVNESLYYKVPLLMYPQTSEQAGVASRVLQLGAGIYLKKIDPSEIRCAAERILTDNSFKKNAAAVSEGFHRCSGVKGAADKILECAKEGNRHGF